MKWLALGLLALTIGAMAWVRLAPHDPARWHVMPQAITDRDTANAAMRIVGAGDDGLSRLDAIIRATPRTTLLFGSLDDGMLTYVTRSRIMGFPDYTTIRAAGPQIEIYARARFGQSDLGVNAARVDGWLAALAQ